METTPVTIATQRLPLKNAIQSGSFVFLNLLKHAAPITPARIPMNWFPPTLEKAMYFSVPSSRVMIVPTTPGFSSVVIIRYETIPARPPTPSLSSDIPRPTPIANKIAMLSIKAPPAFTRRKPIVCSRPTTSPPCIVEGHSQYPIPIRIPQIGRVATGSIKALPSF